MLGRWARAWSGSRWYAVAERIAVVGSRRFRHLPAVAAFVRRLPPGSTVVSGGAPGVDATAEKTARAAGLVVVSIPAQWALYGRAAGFLRNPLIVDGCDRLVAFWDQESRGTKHTIDLARKAGKPVEIVIWVPEVGIVVGN